MKRLYFLFALFLSIYASAQVSLNTINYSYLYDIHAEFTINWKSIRQQEGHLVFFELTTNLGSQVKDYAITFETRKSLGEKTGDSLSGMPEILWSTDKKILGKIKVTVADPYIVARIEHIAKKEVWYVFSSLQKQESFYITKNNLPLIQNYSNVATSITPKSDTAINQLLVSYYKNEFPAAAPAFSTGQARVNKALKADSIFSIHLNETIIPQQAGLYLIQSDTSSSIGQAFRIENDYPKLATLESLAGPLIYICTKQEYEKIKGANGDKKAFDQVILKITGNTDRARNFMRNYFQNVEMANKLFSSYKEGWKTDRGMIYIIFGAPDEVYLFGNREIWKYNTLTKAQFQFVKSPTVFDPENFVLIREKKFTDTWYQVIDLWRKARF